MLVFGFFIVAVVYSAVGFGGGSTYIALLALNGLPAEVIPLIALPCNILVVTIGSYFAVHRRHFDWHLSIPFFITSIPMAFLGGLIRLEATLYFVLLGLSLVIAGMSLLFRTAPTDGSGRPGSRGLAAVIGAGLGFLSGMVGIGGGIFRAPVLHHLRWASSKTIAALCSFFILINSVSGLAGQVLKTGSEAVILAGAYGAPLLLAGAVGGILGGRFVIEGVANQRIAELTGLLVLIVGIRILWV